ncbi:hypothetical protein KPL71_008548 [Citrus sinensis]|uniref:Uncharacterized protein n=1 Tax=Citrus sinensis TaxID=2711 RepID=A0ACB8M882_CITSI|nr:hypothetical protein KPL71_008548 [Citrus sinensis]
MPLTKNEVREDIPKPSWEWNDLEKRKTSLNSKAMNALFCALDKKEFHRVSSCESANEIWHKLEVVYEGTNQVKESKISRYTRQYELFQMEQNKSVYSMYTRFTDIVNTLGALGNTFSNSEKVKKIIRSLPKEWRPKRTTIEEAKNLNILSLDDLIGSLISYEEDLVAEKGHKEKKKSIALKASKYESDGESEPNDEELAMLARRFRNVFKKTGERRKFRNFKNQREKKEVITCYECKKPGHIRSECPLINKLKKKAMVATWDDSDEDSSDEEESQEVSNLALMAIRDNDDLNEGMKKKKNKWYVDNGCSRHMIGTMHGSQASPKLKMVETYLLKTTQKETFLELEMYASLNGKYYAFVIVDDYSRYTWVLFLANKDDAFEAFRIFCKKESLMMAIEYIHPGKALSFSSFAHHLGVRNICRRRDLTNDICNLPFRSQLLPFQVRILHTILQHIVTPRKGHSDEVTRLDAGLLDSLITGRSISLVCVIVRHMLSTLTVNHRLLPYGNIITKILRRFEVPLLDAGPHPPPPRRRSVPQPLADSDSEEREMDADIPSSSELLLAPEQPTAPEPSAVPEYPSTSEPPPAPEQPPASVQPLLRTLYNTATSGARCMRSGQQCAASSSARKGLQVQREGEVAWWLPDETTTLNSASEMVVVRCQSDE